MSIRPTFGMLLLGALVAWCVYVTVHCWGNDQCGEAPVTVPSG